MAKNRKFNINMFSHRIEVDRGKNLGWEPHSYHLDEDSANAWLETCYDVSKIFDTNPNKVSYRIMPLIKKELSDE